MLRFIGLFYPLKRCIWVEFIDKPVRLYRLHHGKDSFEELFFVNLRKRRFQYYRRTVSYSAVWDEGAWHKGGLVVDWGEYRPW
jgi:hypothetical protein